VLRRKVFGVWQSKEKLPEMTIIYSD
jgi:hypothetical protein